MKQKRFPSASVQVKFDDGVTTVSFQGGDTPGFTLSTQTGDRFISVASSSPTYLERVRDAIDGVLGVFLREDLSNHKTEANDAERQRK